MDKRIIIKEEEKEMCQRVVDAGRYGFVKSQYFNAEKDFNDAVSFLKVGLCLTKGVGRWENWQEC